MGTLAETDTQDVYASVSQDGHIGHLYPTTKQNGDKTCMPFAYRYRTHFRPIYKISYKMVTELEWRCCPGYQGYDCMEVKDMRLLQVDQHMSHPPAVHSTGQAGERQHVA